MVVLLWECWCLGQQSWSFQFSLVVFWLSGAIIVGRTEGVMYSNLELQILQWELQSRQVKHTPQILLMNWLFEKWYVGRSRNYCQIQISIPACVMSREYFTRTSLYLVRLKISEWTTLHWRHSHQILVK